MAKRIGVNVMKETEVFQFSPPSPELLEQIRAIEDIRRRIQQTMLVPSWLLGDGHYLQTATLVRGTLEILERKLIEKAMMLKPTASTCETSCD